MDVTNTTILADVGDVMIRPHKYNKLCLYMLDPYGYD